MPCWGFSIGRTRKHSWSSCGSGCGSSGWNCTRRKRGCPRNQRGPRFGRFAEDRRKRKREGKPETFDFLGFTHFSGKTRKGNRFTVRRQTIKKRLRGTLQEIRQELRKRWHEAIAETGKWLRSVVQGYLTYHAVPGNFAALQTFRREVARLWLEALWRRSLPASAANTATGTWGAL